ncbi:hypothetical protein BaRGS_00002613, partial [Batillaria attramentaria]
PPPAQATVMLPSAGVTSPPPSTLRATEMTSHPPSTPQSTRNGDRTHDEGIVPLPWIIVSVLGGVIVVSCIVATLIVIVKKNKGRNNERLSPSQPAMDTEIALRESSARAAYSRPDGNNETESQVYTEIGHCLVLPQGRKCLRSHAHLGPKA